MHCISDALRHLIRAHLRRAEMRDGVSLSRGVLNPTARLSTTAPAESYGILTFARLPCVQLLVTAQLWGHLLELHAFTWALSQRPVSTLDLASTA